MFTIIKRIKQASKKHRPVKSGLVVLSSLLTLTLVYTLIHVKYENSSVNEGLFQAWQTFTTVGYGNAPAQTTLGRYLTMVFGTIGLAVMAVAISIATDIRQYFRDQKRLGLMNNKSKDGYIIINWPGEVSARRLINQIRMDEKDANVCFIDSQIEQLPESIQGINNVHFIKGSLSELGTYNRANISEARSAIVFPREPESPDADITTSAIVSLVLDFILNQTRVLYLLCDSNNKWMFDPDAVPILKNSWALNMVQELQDQDSSLFINSLIDNSDGQSIKSIYCEKDISISIIRRQLEYVANVLGYKDERDSIQLTIDNTDIVPRGGTIFIACDNSYTNTDIEKRIWRN